MTGVEEPQTEAPAAERGRRFSIQRVLGIGLVVFLLIAYIGVNVLYGRSTQADSPLLEIPDEEGEDRLLVALDFTGLSTQESTVTLELKVVANEQVTDEEGYLRDKLEIFLVSLEPDLDRSARALPFEVATATFDADSLISTREVKLRPAGQRHNYPFDVYEGYVGVTAVVTRGKQRKEVPTLLVIGGDAPGWRVESQRGAQYPPDADGETEIDIETSLIRYDVSRAGSTITIVILLLGAMILMVLCAAWVSRSVIKKRRRIEATMASWFAALLFAVVPLRLNMPGAPPMGVWMDFLVVLWVEVGLMIALAIFIYSWLSYTPMPDYAPRPSVGRAGKPTKPAGDASVRSGTAEPPDRPRADPGRPAHHGPGDPAPPAA